MESNAIDDEARFFMKPEEEEEDEEALSLRDLPTNEENSDQLKQEKVDHEEDFNFGYGSFSKESKMCAADEVFFQGQILPMFMRSKSNQSTDHLTSASSRSSSINSHRSSTSGTSSTTSSSAAANAAVRHKLPRRPKSHNQFQFSHPSPKPKPHVHPPGFKNGGHAGAGMNSGRNSTIWSFLRVGLVATPEIKLRSNSSGSRSSRNSCTFGGINKETADKKQRKNKFSDKNRVLFNLSGCKCNVTDAVVGPVPSAPMNAVTRNPTAKEGEDGHAEEEADNSVEGKKKCNDEKKNGTTRKQSVSHHRTFEWLKQLSLEETAVTIHHHNQQ